jgi:hypothetical protein
VGVAHSASVPGGDREGRSSSSADDDQRLGRITPQDSWALHMVRSSIESARWTVPARRAASAIPRHTAIQGPVALDGGVVELEALEVGHHGRRQVILADQGSVQRDGVDRADQARSAGTIWPSAVRTATARPSRISSAL